MKKRVVLMLLLAGVAAPQYVRAQSSDKGQSILEGPAGSVLPAPDKTMLETEAPPLVSPHAHAGGNGRLSVFADYLYWTVHGGDVPYAQAFDGIDPALSVPRGQVGVVAPQFQSGFRIGGGVSLDGCSAIVGTYTYFNTDRSTQIAAGPGNVLHNFLVFPNTINSAVDSVTASADYHIQLQMADLDYRRAFVSTDCLTINWLVGLRYAHLEQDLVNTFQVTGSTTVDSHIGFDGIGPRAGLQGEYRCKSGLFCYANGIFDVLFGQFRGNYTEQNVFTGIVGQTGITANRAVPILEMELGVGWQNESGCIRVSAGYYIGAWCNVMTTTSLASAVANVNFTTNGNNFRDNLVFDGLVARFEFRY
jgi:hypothetical protein